MSLAREIVKKLGGDLTPTGGTVAGLNHSPRDRSMSITDAPDHPDGIICHSFAGDDPLAFKDFLRDQGLLPPRDFVHREQPRPAQAKPIADDSAKIARTLAIWGETRPLPGTVAETYLATRGLAAGGLAHVLRFHPACPFGAGRLTCLVGLLRNIETNEPTGIHRTALTADGQKIDRKMLGRSKGAAIKLSANDEVELGLGICEGIETGLSILQAGWRPIWALGSAGAIAEFPILPGVEALTIWADNDDAGIAAATAAADRWKAAGREVICRWPSERGHDFNDGFRQ